MGGSDWLPRVRLAEAVAQDDSGLIKRLTELNQQISEGARSYSPFE